MKKKTKIHKYIAYMDGIALHYELGHTEVKLYESKKAVLDAHPCAKGKSECGVATVEVMFVEWAKKPFVKGTRKKK